MGVCLNNSLRWPLPTLRNLLLPEVSLLGSRMSVVSVNTVTVFWVMRRVSVFSRDMAALHLDFFVSSLLCDRGSVILKYGKRVDSSSRHSIGIDGFWSNFIMWTVPPIVQVLAIWLLFLARLVWKYISACLLSRYSLIKILLSPLFLRFKRAEWIFRFSQGFASSTSIGRDLLVDSLPIRLAWKLLTVTSRLFNRAFIIISATWSVPSSLSSGMPLIMTLFAFKAFGGGIYFVLCTIGTGELLIFSSIDLILLSSACIWSEFSFVLLWWNRSACAICSTRASSGSSSSSNFISNRVQTMYYSIHE